MLSSPNYQIPVEPNPTLFSHVTDFKNVIGTVTTLDDSPPSFSRLQIKDPTQFNTKMHPSVVVGCRRDADPHGEEGRVHG